MKKDIQSHIGLKKGNVGEYVLLLADPKRTELIASFFDDAKEIAFNCEFSTFTDYIRGYNGKKIKVSTTSTRIVYPSAAICIEELANIAAKVFIRVGTAEKLQKYANIADIVISQTTICEDSTSKQYASLSFPTIEDLAVVDTLVSVVKKVEG